MYKGVNDLNIKVESIRNLVLESHSHEDVSSISFYCSLVANFRSLLSTSPLYQLWMFDENEEWIGACRLCYRDWECI